MNQEYTFTLKFKLPFVSTDSQQDALVDQLYANGCDDALIGTGLLGQLAVEFIREAASLEEALITALKDVLNTLPSAEFIEVSPSNLKLQAIEQLAAPYQQTYKLNKKLHLASC